VFTISLSDTQKVVNIWSALVLHNKMEIPLEIRPEIQKWIKKKAGKSNTIV